jgi:hypothetical protein
MKIYPLQKTLKIVLVPLMVLLRPETASGIRHTDGRLNGLFLWKTTRLKYSCSVIFPSS